MHKKNGKYELVASFLNRRPRGRSVVLLLVLSLFVLMSLFLIGSCGRRKKPNIVLISIDTLRPDRLSCYGNLRRTSPALDSMTANGIRFTNAFSPSPWTLPAHASMLTGRYPSSLAPDPNDFRLYRTAPLLSTLLGQAGYKTGAVTGGGWLSEDLGASRGFNYFKGRGEVNDATQWLKANHKRPFFLFFHTYVVHAPYRYRRFAVDHEGGRFTEIYTPGDKGERHLDVCCRGVELTPPEKNFLLALYDGGIVRADEMVRKLLTALKKLKVLNNTIIIVTSDHGEEFWEHTDRGAYHGHTLYDELLRVPLIWYDPEIKSPGRDISVPVSLVDIVPTLLARVGLESSEPFDGENLQALLEGRDWTVNRALFGEAVRHGPYRVSVQTSEAKLIVTPDTGKQRCEGARFPVPVRAPRELYLAGDIREQNNVISSQSLLLSDLTVMLDDHFAKRSRTTPGGEPVSLDQETLEHLRSLGYLQ